MNNGVSLMELLRGQSMVPPITTPITIPKAGTNPGSGLWDSLSTTLSSPGFWQGAGNIMGGLGSIGNIWLGSQSLGLLEDQLAMQQNAWDEQKKELDYIRQTRDKLNTSYMA
jgi:hypothetical protein